MEVKQVQEIASLIAAWLYTDALFVVISFEPDQDRESQVLILCRCRRLLMYFWVREWLAEL